MRPRTFSFQNKVSIDESVSSIPQSEHLPATLYGLPVRALEPPARVYSGAISLSQKTSGPWKLVGAGWTAGNPPKRVAMSQSVSSNHSHILIFKTICREKVARFTFLSIREAICPWEHRALQAIHSSQTWSILTEFHTNLMTDWCGSSRHPHSPHAEEALLISIQKIKNKEKNRWRGGLRYGGTDREVDAEADKEGREGGRRGGGGLREMQKWGERKIYHFHKIWSKELRWGCWSPEAHRHPLPSNQNYISPTHPHITMFFAPTTQCTPVSRNFFHVHHTRQNTSTVMHVSPN